MTKPDSTLSDAHLLALKAQAATLTADRPETRVAVSIIRTLSKHLSDAEWIALYRGVPPEVMPLSPRQLEAMRGGNIAFDEVAFPFPASAIQS